MKEVQFLKAINRGQLEWSVHALRKMLERGVSRDAVKYVLCEGDKIEDYPKDTPFPSGLYFAMWQGQPLHVVAAFDENDGKIFVITTYLPDSEHFELDFRTRRSQ
jgi:hypothetical protein